MRSRSSFAELARRLTLVAATMGCGTGSAGVVLEIRAPPGDRDADVYVDGNYVGQVGALDNPATGEVRLAPGTHRVEVRKPGRFPVQRTLRVTRRSAPRHVVEAELLEDPQ